MRKRKFDDQEREQPQKQTSEQQQQQENEQQEEKQQEEHKEQKKCKCRKQLSETTLVHVPVRDVNNIIIRYLAQPKCKSCNRLCCQYCNKARCRMCRNNVHEECLSDDFEAVCEYHLDRCDDCGEDFPCDTIVSCDECSHKWCDVCDEAIDIGGRFCVYYIIR